MGWRLLAPLLVAKMQLHYQIGAFGEEVPAVFNNTKGKKVETSTENAAKKAVEALREEAQSNAKQLPAETDEQAVLLAALGLFLRNWPNLDVAKSVEVDFALIPLLNDLEEGQSLILEGPALERRLEIKRATGDLEVEELMQCHFCPWLIPPRCCVTINSARSVTKTH